MDEPSKNGGSKSEGSKFAGLHFARVRPVDKNTPTGRPLTGPERFARAIAPVGITPDQGCFASIIGGALLLASISFWVWTFYHNSPEFNSAAKQGPPASQIEQERSNTRRSRINP